MLKAVQKTISKILGIEVTIQQTRTIAAVISAIGYESKMKIPEAGIIALDAMPGQPYYDMSNEQYGIIVSMEHSILAPDNYQTRHEIQIVVMIE